MQLVLDCAMGSDSDEAAGRGVMARLNERRELWLLYAAYAYYIGLILIVFRGPGEPRDLPSNIEIVGISTLVLMWFAAIGVIVNKSNVWVALATCIFTWLVAFALMEPEFEDDDYYGQFAAALYGFLNTLLFLIAFGIQAMVHNWNSSRNSDR